MVNFYVVQIKMNKIEIDDVPKTLRNKVENALK